MLRPSPDKVDPISRTVRLILRRVCTTGLPPRKLGEGLRGWAVPLALDLIDFRCLVQRERVGRPSQDTPFKLTERGAGIAAGLDPVLLRPEDTRALVLYYIHAAGGKVKSQELALWLHVNVRTARTRLREVGATPSGREWSIHE